jgi:hypothetical protein
VSATVSNEGLELVWSLYERRRLLDRVRSHGDRTTILKRIAESRQLGLVPDLLPLVLIDEPLAPEVGRTIAALVQDATPLQFAWLDEQIRMWRHGVSWSDAWHTANPETVSRAVQAPRLETVAIGFIASHRNGFVRAAVLEVLAQRVDCREIPFLCLRSNDWVEPVAARAVELLVSRFRPENRHAVLDVLPFVLRMFRMRRRDHARVEQALVTLLLADGGQAALAHGASLSTEVRRAMYGLMMRTGKVPRPLVDAALNDSDAVIRARVLRVVAGDSGFERRGAMFDRLLRDAAPVVRRLALAGVSEHEPERVAALFPDVLLDRAARVRALARFVARAHRLTLIPRDIYVEALSSSLPTRLSAAIEGVGESGGPADADLIEPFSGATKPRIRRSALRAIAKLDPPRAVALALAALADDAPSVRAAAVGILANNARLVDFDVFRRRVSSLPDPQVRGSVLRVFLEAPKWDAAAFLLATLTDPDEIVRRSAGGLVARWIEGFNRTQIQPTESQVRRISELLDVVGSELSDDSARMLRFSLKPL